MTDADQAAKAQQDAEKKRADEVRKKLTEERSAREKARTEMAQSQTTVKPTPTQEENDLAASGVHLSEHEPDGSPDQVLGLDPRSIEEKKQAEANKPTSKGSYQNRAATTTERV
jgi:hypothetical protein